jgi:RNA polymerase sigma factor (sigma-70 family)
MESTIGWACARSSSLAHLSDERLVELAATQQSISARNVLIERYHEWLSEIILRLAQQTCLNQHDVEDARQETAFWCAEAIDRFDLAQLNSIHPCHFRTFLYHVVSLRFKDFLRRERRQLRSKVLSEPEACLFVKSCSEAEKDGNSYFVPFATTIIDPVQCAERRESMRRLHAILATLDRLTRYLGESLCQGHSLRDTASMLGISYEKAKRKRRKMIEHLKFCLRD